MSDADLLVTWALLTPLVGALLGFIWARCPAWDFVDLVYYPLGILGVVLFFFATQRERDLLSARETRLETERVWARQPNVRPEIGIDHSSFESLRLNYDQMLDEQRVGDSCRNLPSHSCIAYADHAEAISKTIGAVDLDWGSPDAEVRLRTLHSFCAATSELIERLDREVFDADAYAALKQHLARRRVRNPFLPNPNDLAQDIAQRQSRWLEAIPQARRSWAKERIEIEGRFALILFDAAGRCAARQVETQETIQRLDAWRSKERGRLNTTRSQEGRIATLSRQGDGRDPLLWMRLKLWPYVIILALALKFGRGVAGVTAAWRRKRETEEPTQSGPSDAPADAAAGTDPKSAQP